MRYRWIPYQESMQQEWDQLAQKKGTVFHTTGFRQILLESFPYRCGYQAFMDNTGKICGLLPLVIGRNLKLQKVGVSLPFANQVDVCADMPELIAPILATISQMQQTLGLSELEIRLKSQDVVRTLWRANLDNYTFVLPLLTEEEQTLAQASPGCRNHVRKTYKNDWFAVSFDHNRLAEFYEVYVRRMKQLGSPAPGLNFFQRFFTYLPDSATLLTVLDRKTGRVIGGMLLLKSPADQTLYYPYGANLIEYNHQYLNNFMYWEAAKYGIRCGLKSLDLGRSQTDSGTYRYKSQWGAQPVQLRYLRYGATAGELSTNERETFRYAIALWKRLPRLLTDPLGRKVIPFLLP